MDVQVAAFRHLAQERQQKTRGWWIESKWCAVFCSAVGLFCCDRLVRVQKTSATATSPANRFTPSPCRTGILPDGRFKQSFKKNLYRKDRKENRKGRKEKLCDCSELRLQ